MISAPQGMATGLSRPPGSQCAAAPPLIGGGFAASVVPRSPMQVSAPLVGGGFGAPGIPATGAMTATSGAATLGGAGPVVSTNLVGGPAAAMPVLGTWPAAAPVVATITGSPALLGQGAAATAALPMPISTVTPAGASAAPAPAAGAAGTQPLTTLAPGGSPQDAALVEQTLNVLRQSPSGAQVVDRLLAVGAKINVISDAEFQSMGHDSAHAFYDPKIDTMFLRRSDLADAKNINFAAVALAHEGTHLLDDVANLADPMVSQITSNVVAAGGLNTPAGIEAREQGMFELMMVKEARAFTFAGQVARDLQVKLDDTDPTKVAISGGNDQTTYNAVWQRLLQSSYNPQGRTATVRNL